MPNNILEYIDEWLTLINEYKFIDKMSEIVNKILRLEKVLNEGKERTIAAITKEIYENTDFEGIEIKWRNNTNQSRYLTIRMDAKYLIDRLTLLAFKKISEHELDKGIEQFGTEAKVVYKGLKLALEEKKVIFNAT